jgi:hypothetical protein
LLALHSGDLTYPEPMLGMSEDEGDGDDDDEPVVKVDEEKNEAARKAREARQEKLRGMFDDDGRPLRINSHFTTNTS